MKNVYCLGYNTGGQYKPRRYLLGALGEIEIWPSATSDQSTDLSGVLERSGHRNKSGSQKTTRVADMRGDVHLDDLLGRLLVIDRDELTVWSEESRPILTRLRFNSTAAEGNDNQ